MVRGLYAAGTGMLTQRKRMDVLTNNIANVETTGYKKDTLASRTFKDMLLERIQDPSYLTQTNRVGAFNGGLYVDQLYTGFEQGPMDGTDSQSDMALAGDGFFAVETPNGQRYTRDGSFVVSQLGYLTTAEGYPVAGERGTPIYVGSGEFAVDEAGRITVDGRVVNQLRIVAFADNGGLRKEGDNFFVNYTNQPVLQADCTVKQNFLEMSNVDISQSMVDMIEINRSYESAQRVVKTVDETLSKAVNDVGRV